MSIQCLLGVPPYRKLGAEASSLQVQASTRLAVVLWEQIVGLAEDKLLLDLSIFVNCWIIHTSPFSLNTVSLSLSLSLLSTPPSYTHLLGITAMSLDCALLSKTSPTELLVKMHFSRLLVIGVQNPAFMLLFQRSFCL